MIRIDARCLRQLSSFLFRHTKSAVRPHVDIYSENNYLSAKLINMLRGNCCRKCPGNEEKRSESGRSASVSVRLRLREFVNPLMATLKLHSTLKLQRGGAWTGCGPAQSFPRCTKCNSPSINGQCSTNFILFDAAL